MPRRSALLAGLPIAETWYLAIGFSGKYTAFDFPPMQGFLSLSTTP